MVTHILPLHGDVFPDHRGEGRGLRVSWHHEAGLVVVSIWRDGTCAATVQLRPEDVPAVIAALAGGLAAGYPVMAGEARDAS